MPLQSKLYVEACKMNSYIRRYFIHVYLLGATMCILDALHSCTPNCNWYINLNMDREAIKKCMEE